MNSQEKINILLVDDRQDGLITLEAVLKCEEYELFKARSGREALQALLEHDFACIILDVQMPEMDGYETASLIKQREKSRQIPILFVTAIHKDPLFVFRGYEAGAVDYLSKPFDARILKSKVAVFAELFRKSRALMVQADLLKQSEEANRILIESARDIIVTASIDGVITSLSPAFETITGWSASEWVGKPFNSLVSIHDLDKTLGYFKEILQGQAVLFETHINGKLGQSIWVEASAQPLRQENNIIGAIAVVRDITERKEIEREKKLRLELERSNTELEQFAHICSHDLQEPLRTLNSFACLLKEMTAGKLNAEATELIDGLIEGASRMSFLISDLLDYAHMGSSDIPLSPIESTKALEEAIKNLQQIIRDTGAQITHTALPVVLGNEPFLLQLFQNLISNSLKFRNAGIPRIHVSAENREGEWVFAVKDNGIGFKMEYSEKIFQVFKRLHHSDRYPGTGIGLGICKRIVERQGGRIWAESELGKGSIFFFTLQEPPTVRNVLPLKPIASVGLHAH